MKQIIVCPNKTVGNATVDYIVEFYEGVMVPYVLDWKYGVYVPYNKPQFENKPYKRLVVQSERLEKTLQLYCGKGDIIERW